MCVCVGGVRAIGEVVGGVRAIGEEKMVVFFCEEEGENGHSVKVECLVIFKKKILIIVG